MSIQSVTRTARTDVKASRTINDIGEEYFEFTLEKEPLYASFIGDHRYDHLLPTISAERRKKDQIKLDGFKAELKAIDPLTLSDSDHVRYDLLLHEIDTLIGIRECHFPLWIVDQLDGPQIGLMEIANNHRLSDVKDVHNLLERYRQIHGYLRDHVANLREGRSMGLTAAKINIAHVIDQLEAQLSEDPKLSPFMIAAEKMPNTLTKQQKADFTSEILAVINGSIYPALKNYRDYLKFELMPDARESIGLSSINRGAHCYEKLIERHTGLKRSPHDIHEEGVREVARIKELMHKLITDNTDLADEKAFIAQLRKDPKQYLKTAEELIAHNHELVQRANDALPKAFGILPKTKITVMPLEDYRQKHAPAAYYYEAPADGSRPAHYYLNTYQAERRPLFNMAALAFHEAVPGHHLQIALANENAQIPRFQRHLGQTAFVEGWALYAELLSRELKLYQGIDEEFGSLNYELWRALRLVVDTGIHYHAWSREKAIAYLANNSALTNDEITNEIDRYIVWPGQALAYKIGQMEFLRLRKMCEENLGDRFSLSQFHDQVLKNGAVPMATLASATKRWLAAQGVAK